VHQTPFYYCIIFTITRLVTSSRLVNQTTFRYQFGDKDLTEENTKLFQPRENDARVCVYAKVRVPYKFYMEKFRKVNPPLLL